MENVKLTYALIIISHLSMFHNVFYLLKKFQDLHLRFINQIHSGCCYSNIQGFEMFPVPQMAVIVKSFESTCFIHSRVLLHLQ